MSAPDDPEPDRALDAFAVELGQMSRQDLWTVAGETGDRYKAAKAVVRVEGRRIRLIIQEMLRRGVIAVNVRTALHGAISRTWLEKVKTESANATDPEGE